MSATERLVLDLPAELVSALRTAVESGDFASESEAVEVLLRMWCADSAEEPDIATLRAFVDEGIADADAGRVCGAEEVYARVLARIDATSAKKTR